MISRTATTRLRLSRGGKVSGAGRGRRTFPEPRRGTVVSIILALAGILYLGIIPGGVMEMAKLAIF
jgi:hypothetical protein